VDGEVSFLAVLLDFGSGLWRVLELRAASSSSSLQTESTTYLYLTSM